MRVFKWWKMFNTYVSDKKKLSTLGTILTVILFLQQYIPIL